ncbi:uncharacterized protein LOC141843692 [Curcuma longa]|uniref:uncharacterized protein LOC141843692 n=1 Tax=Curcuma longa TaxID=136217 RepID=UPI003D9DB9A9
MNSKMERLVWVAKNSFLIIGMAAWLLIPSSLDLLLLLHRYSFLIPLALWLWLWLCKKEVAGSNNGAVVVPQATPAPPVASSVENFYDFLFFKPQEEQQQQQHREYCDVDEPSAASPGPAWWLSEPGLMVGKEAAAAEFSWDGVVDSKAWKGADVAPSAPPIATAYSASFFPFDEFCGPPLPSKAEGGWEHNKSMEETWKAICVMKEEEEEGRRRTVKEEEAGGGRRKREVPAVKKDELFRRVDQRHLFEFDLQREESPVRRPRVAVELDWRHHLPRP